MSKKQHKGNHASREERRAAEKRARESVPTTIRKPRRVYLRNGLFIFLTLLSVLGALGVLLLLGLTGWWDNVIGSILVVAVGAFACMCLYDLGLLISACVAFGEGLVNAGKDPSGARMIFHASSVVRLELRDTNGRTLLRDRKVYRNVNLTFVMQSGRTNIKWLSRLTEAQLAALEEALANEKKLDCAH